MITIPSSTRARLLVALISLTLVACGGTETTTPPDSAQAATAGVDTLMLTYETVISPDGKTVRFQVVSDGNFVRLGNETESWRLFDTKRRMITFVDQTAGTAREVSYDDALAERMAMLNETDTSGTPSPSVVDGPGAPEKGHPTRRIRIDVGNFSRELVLSDDELLPREFFAMKVVTDSIDPRYASIMKHVLPTLLRQTGTLLSETNELTLSEEESITAVTKLISVNTTPLAPEAFRLPDGISPTSAGEEETSTPEE